MSTDPIPIVFITGNALRHRWAAWQLSEDPRFELRGVVRESKRALPGGTTAEDDALLQSHLAERQAAEMRHFGDAPEFEALGAPILDVEWGHSNDLAVAEWVDARSPRYLQLFGCSIIRAPLLERYAERAVNIHLGLSPYYRGTATNFWPLVNGEPELVGATIHLATLSVDAGPILRQARPEIEAGDGAHDVGCRALAAGIAALRDALAAYAGEELKPIAQEPGGRLYKNADFHPGAVAQMRERLANGSLREYLDDAEARRARFPIVT